MDIRDIDMQANDAGAKTLGEYIIRLAKAVWDQDAIKRPFGNSDWKYEVYGSLARANLIPRTVGYQDEDYIDYDYDEREGDHVVSKMFEDWLDPKKQADHAVDVRGFRMVIMHPPLCDMNCKVSKAANYSVLPVPDKDGRYPIYVDNDSRELRIIE